MESILIYKVAFYLRNIQYRIGYFGVLGLSMLVVAIALYFSLNLPQTRHLHSVEAARAQLSTHQSQPDKLKTPQHILSAEAFFKQFPDSVQKDTSLKTIIAIAEQNALTLVTGKYETLIKESGSVVFYQISFPLEGNFPQIKRFLATTLNTLPNAALSHLRLHRPSIESNQIEADVIFTLYFYRSV